MAAFLHAFVTLFAILDALGNIPVFLTLTADMDPAARRRTALRSPLYMAAVLMFFSVAGRVIFQVFGITLPAFRVTGGLILLKVGFDMMEARGLRMKHTQEEEAEALTREDVSLIPLAVPMLAGPGAISATLALTETFTPPAGLPLLWGAVAANAVCVYVAFRLAEPLSRWLGETGVRLTTRLMGLVLTSLAVQFILDGIRELWGA